MGLVDRIKETAQQGIDKGQAKVSEQRAKQATADLLRNLGLVAYRQRTGQGDTAALDAQAASLVEALNAQVEAHGPLPEPTVPAAAS